MRRLLALMAFLMLPLAALAQDTATLVADRVEIRGDSVLAAEGNVEVLHKGMRMTATRVLYDSTADTLSVEGPITLTDATGTRVLADQAEMSADLTEGLLTGARLVLDQQLQLAATEILRVGGRYTRLGRTVASSCQVCAESPVPLWEIRARRVIHDELERQIYFDHAQLRVAGVPVFYLPRLRMPDPTLKRVTGFLTPSFRTTSELGPGVRLPYFITLGESRDLTLTPYVSADNMRTLGLRYRQAFETGRIEVEGAISTDDIRPDDTRGYLFANGAFALPRDYRLGFGVQTASDNSYLLDYGISEQDVLTSFLRVDRVRGDQLFLARALYLESLRDGGNSDDQPSSIIDAVWLRRVTPDVIGGIAQLRLEGHAHSRNSPDGSDDDADGVPDGRDITRLGFRADWRRDAVFGPGFLATGLAAVRADITGISQDPDYPSEVDRAEAMVGGELRWPLVKTERSGATQIFEPTCPTRTARSCSSTRATCSP